MTHVAAGPIRMHFHDGIAEVVLDRAEVSNALDLETARRLSAALRDAATDSAVRVVLVTGAGPHFCAGGDVAAMATATRRSSYVRTLAEAAHEAVLQIHAMPKPVVVAVNGAAAGIGFSLALGADIVVASDTATFVTAYTTVGLTPDGGMSWLLPRIVGQRRALELILSSETLSAEEARTLGIVSRVCPREDLLDQARQLSSVVAGRPSEALAVSRALVRSSWSVPLHEHMAREVDEISRAADSTSATAMMNRFVGR